MALNHTLDVTFIFWVAGKSNNTEYFPLELSRIVAEQSYIPKAKPQTNYQEIVFTEEN